MTGTYHALLVGNGHYPYEPGLPDLRGPVNDVLELARALTDPGVGLFDERNVVMLVDHDGPEIVRALTGLCARTAQDDLLLVYYSGHGLPGPAAEGSLRLCTRDTVHGDEEHTTLGFPDLDAVLRTSAAAVTLIILDCCYSGAAKTAPTGTYLAARGSRGRHVLTACRERETTPDAVSLTTTSRFTGYLVAGLRCGAERPGAEDTRLSDLFDFAYRRMEADGAGGTPTHKASMTGSPHVVVGRLPPLAPPPPPGPSAAGPPAGPARPEGPPAWLRGAGRWALALLLVVAGYAGAGGTLASTDEMAYRSQWRLAEGAARSTAYEGIASASPIGHASVMVALLVVACTAGAVLAVMLLARLLGAWWWLPGAGLVLLTAYGMWQGLSFYGENTAPVLPLAVLLTGTALWLPAREPRDVRRTAPLVLGAVAAAWPGAYLAYTRGLYDDNSWTVAERMTYQALKDSTAFESVTFVWAAAALGIVLGAAAAHRLLPLMPVLGRRTAYGAPGTGSAGAPVRVRPTPLWLRRLTVWAFGLVVLPAAVWMAVGGYLGRWDREFDDPALRAMASPWISGADSCAGLTCARSRFDASYEVTFHPVGDRELALQRYRERIPADPARIAHSGGGSGYSYVITRYDGHDGALVWTHERCACYAEITLHNNTRGYEEAVSDFWYATALTEPRT
ncbi:caspase family protein [Streptomyces sp. NPDC127110]|uniref:caspase, EACC1-associated type n=1 Tax=Streptomyces sp. NPDC127110 TaxID=3345362 RepID=UPI00363604DC